MLMLLSVPVMLHDTVIGTCTNAGIAIGSIVWYSQHQHTMMHTGICILVHNTGAILHRCVTDVLLYYVR